MNILIPIDIEDEVRKALVPYFANVVAGDLPPNFPTPILRVRQTGGGTANTIDNFNVSHKDTSPKRGEGAHKC